MRIVVVFIAVFSCYTAADVQKDEPSNDKMRVHQVWVTQQDEQALKYVREGLHLGGQDQAFLKKLGDLIRANQEGKMDSLESKKDSLTLPAIPARRTRRHGRNSKAWTEHGRALSEKIHAQIGRRLSNVTVAIPDPLASITEAMESAVGDMATVTDTIWLLVCGTFVFFMHAGFAMLEAGTCRAKNVQAVLIKNLLTVCVGTLGWYFLGWSLAYGGDVKTANWKEGTFEECDEKENPMGCGDGYADNGLIGGAHMFVGSGFLGKGKDADKAWEEGVISPSTYGGGQAYMWFFQWAFCTAAASIVSGGIAERVRFPAYICYSFFMSGFIYPVIVCSTWGYGWLETFKKDKDGVPIAGYIDFAGSGVVHLTGGISALVGAAIVGRRAGRFDPEQEADFCPHSQPLIVLGTFILWFGWCGFNSGSTLAMSDAGTALKAAMVMMNTTISAATGGVTVFLLRFAITKKYDCAALCNGILAGLVSITAGCSNVESGSALFIGFMGAFIVVGSAALVQKCKVDDPVDAFSVHGACGIWGCLAAALFDFGSGTDKHHGWGGFSATSWSEDGEAKYMTTGDAMGANICEVVFVIVWSGGLSAVAFGLLRLAGVLRIHADKEEAGCDTECVSPTGYSIKPAGGKEAWEQK